MDISIIVAQSENRVIGQSGDLPWRLSDDLKHFKKITSGHTIIMGRKTYASIGKPLPNRRNVVITRQTDLEINGCLVVNSLEDAIQMTRDKGETEAFIIGGGEIYKQSLSIANKLYLTLVKTVIDGDTFFPEIDYNFWNETSLESFQANDKNEYAFDMVILERK